MRSHGSVSGCSSSLAPPRPAIIVEFFLILAVFSWVMDLTRVAKESLGGGPGPSLFSSWRPEVFNFSSS